MFLKLDFVLIVNIMFDDVILLCIMCWMFVDSVMFLWLYFWWMWYEIVWLLNSDVNMCLIVISMVL